MSINAKEVASARIQIKAICQSMKDGKLSFIEGTRSFLDLAPIAAIDENDPDFVVFVGIVSETDEVPKAEVQRAWNNEAIARLNSSWDQAESWARNVGLLACENLIRRL